MKYKLLSMCAATVFLISSCSKSQNGAVNHESGKMANKIETVTILPAGGNSNKHLNHIGDANDDTYKPPVDTSENGGDNPIDSNCAGVFCTEDFRQIQLEILDAKSNPVKLDAFYTEDMQGNKMPNYLDEYNSYNSYYVVFNDAWRNGHTNSTIQVRFVGIKNGATVVKEVYTITTDCCHIAKNSGKDKVIIP